MKAYRCSKYLIAALPSMRTFTQNMDIGRNTSPPQLRSRAICFNIFTDQSMKTIAISIL